MKTTLIIIGFFAMLIAFAIVKITLPAQAEKERILREYRERKRLEDERALFVEEMKARAFVYESDSALVMRVAQIREGV